MAHGSSMVHAPKPSPTQRDLLTLPLRACVAFAARCARRVQSLLASFDEETRAAADRVLRMAEDYAVGNDHVRKSVSEAVEGIQPKWLIVTRTSEEHALKAVNLLVRTVFFAAHTPACLSLGWKRTQDVSLTASLAAEAAKAAVTARPECAAAVWADLDLLKSAVEQGRISADTPVSQSFFEANTEPPSAGD